MKTTCIVTVLNEEKTIVPFLSSFLSQSILPDEIVIVDGGSTDNTLSLVSTFKSKTSNKKMLIKVYVKQGNRSVGRNEAIKKASAEVILCTDAGCILDKYWVENIAQPFHRRSVNVVAGYYKAKSRSIFQRCLVPYVLVMPDKVNEKNFLPSSRSLAFRKSVWRKVGGFPEKFSHNEDYVFAKKLKEMRVSVKFQKNAIVEWIPRNSFRQAFTMFFRFALGDSEAAIIRPKVLLIFLRYIGAVALVVFIVDTKLQFFSVLSTLFVVYTFWAIAKNYHYVKDIRALYYLPLLQLTADFSVMLGTAGGVYKRLFR